MRDVPRSVSPWQRIAAQTRIEMTLLLRSPENLLVTFGIPLMVLVFFSTVPVLPVPEGSEPIEFLAPGVLAMSVIGSSLVSLGIQTGFERFYLVMKRLGASPLRRSELVVAKAVSTIGIEFVQIIAVVTVAVVLGWRPDPIRLLLTVPALAMGTAAFAGIGLAVSGRFSALQAMAAINAVFLVLIVTSGIMFPLDRLPDAAVLAVRLLPSAPLTEWLRAAVDHTPIPTLSLFSLPIWAVIGPVTAASVFKWE